MPYQLKLQPGRQLVIDNAGGQTMITLLSSSLGQQQQSSQSIYTGTWTAPPQAYRTSREIVIHLQTNEGDRTLYVDQTQIQMTESRPVMSGAEPIAFQEVASSSMPAMSPMEPMKPMEPMPPMGTLSMGNMQMSMNPMEMQMGKMKLSMDASDSSKSNSPSADSQRRFCSQCGARVQESDRFCASCGHQLGT